MKLSEYIEKRTQVLDNQVEEVMKQDTINVVAMTVIQAQIGEMEMIRIALEDGRIEGI